jgi:integrase
MFWSGLRPSEAVALRWKDIDFEKGIIRVRRAKTVYDDKPGATKTKRSRRYVRLLTLARESLLAQREHTRLQNGEVFINPDTGEGWSGAIPLRKAWKTALERAGVEYRKPYQTRHTYATMMLISGEDPLWLAVQMGHTNMSMIIRHYAHWMPDRSPEAGKKAEAMFGKVKG